MTQAEPTNPYRRGLLYEVMPLPPERRFCTDVDAGPVRFTVESRRLTTDILHEQLPQFDDRGGQPYDDRGATLHVYDTASDQEILRFDCFDNEPHYHYILHGSMSNLVCRIDEVAVGDPTEWALRCIRHRLAEMLEFAGAPVAAQGARQNPDRIRQALMQLDELMAKARSVARYAVDRPGFPPDR